MKSLEQRMEKPGHSLIWNPWSAVTTTHRQWSCGLLEMRLWKESVAEQMLNMKQPLQSSLTGPMMQIIQDRWRSVIISWKQTGRFPRLLQTFLQQREELLDLTMQTEVYLTSITPAIPTGLSMAQKLHQRLTAVESITVQQAVVRRATSSWHPMITQQWDGELQQVMHGTLFWQEILQPVNMCGPDLIILESQLHGTESEVELLDHGLHRRTLTLESLIQRDLQRTATTSTRASGMMMWQHYMFFRHGTTTL